MHTRIMGIKLTDRMQAAVRVQQLLTEYGCLIKTRLGMHVADGSCNESGLIIIELTDDADNWEELNGKLSELSGVQVKTMLFE
ncbi:MAG: hypothetical protein ACOCWH_01555 [Spirochaetota bacterium]